MAEARTFSVVALADLEEAIQLAAHDRSHISPDIAHLRVGGFHRVLRAFHLGSFMSRGEALDFGIVGLGPMPSAVKIRHAPAGKDSQYAVVVNDPECARASVASLIVQQTARPTPSHRETPSRTAGET